MTKSISHMMMTRMKVAALTGTTNKRLIYTMVCQHQLDVLSISERPLLPVCIAKTKPLLTPWTLSSFTQKPNWNEQRRHSGHNKWSKIKHQKTANDVAKCQVISRVVRQVTAAVRAMKGETDPSQNQYLASALQIAKAANVPKSKVEEAIKRGVAVSTPNGGNGEDIKRVVYEGLTPVKSIGVMIEAHTTNVNKTANEIRHLFNAAAGAALTPVSYMFSERRGRIVFAPGSGKTPNDGVIEMTDAAIEVGVDDIGDDTVEEEDEGGQRGRPMLEVFVSFENLVATQKALVERGYDICALESGNFALEQVLLEDREEIAAVEAFVEALEAQNEVIRVAHNGTWK